jgi:hypothetical protein
MPSPRSRSISRRWTAPLIALVAGGCAAPPALTDEDVASKANELEDATDPVDSTFVVRGIAQKCIDFGPPPQPVEKPVFLFRCNGTPAQSVRVVETETAHYVTLHAGDKCIGMRAGIVIERAPLELEECDGSDGQSWALDGDSIRPRKDLDLVVIAKEGRGADRTPLVLARRHYDDTEFWRFDATGASARPTSGFVRVTDATKLPGLLKLATENTVIEIDGTLDVSAYKSLPVNAGVTVRSYRRGLEPRGELRFPVTAKKALFEISADRARITDLVLRGPSPDTDDGNPEAKGVYITKNVRVTIDHNDISGWTSEGIGVVTDDAGETCELPIVSRPRNVLITRNFIHANRQDGLGYGVVTGDGGLPIIDGNTFQGNRHAIASGGSARSGYDARFNLVLSSAPKQYAVPFGGYTHDFDMHGTSESSEPWVPEHTGGVGGEEIDIQRNTFLGDNRENFDLRGVPCYRARFHENVSMRERDDAVHTWVGYDALEIRDNQFDSSNPTDRLGVGDFDGDQRDDLFLATGAAWYYSPRGKMPWRLLGRRNEKLDALRFGDFDGDGRTDVLWPTSLGWFVSWGGASAWEKVNSIVAPVSDLLVGDFDGDRKSDVFYANGSVWQLSKGAVAPWSHFATSGYRASALRVGDMNRDGKSDVFAVANDAWSVVYGGESRWTTLRSKLTESVDGLVLADFDGDGRADVAQTSGGTWRVSHAGTGNWVTLLTDAPASLGALPVGRFDDAAGADVLYYGGLRLDTAPSGTAPRAAYSIEEMR